MTSYLYERKVRISDYLRFAEPFRDELRENAKRLATEAGLEIEFIRKRSFRKEDPVKEIRARRGEHPGLVAIFSAMELYSTYIPWHDTQTGRTFLKPDGGKCLHYYFYFVDEELGLRYVRMPTGCPAGCRSTSTVTIGLPTYCANAASTSPCWTTLSTAPGLWSWCRTRFRTSPICGFRTVGAIGRSALWNLSASSYLLSGEAGVAGFQRP
jgi:hypothetical protein